jgi:transaldolase
VNTTYRFYADSANERDVDDLLQPALISGVTTNPTILSRSSLGADDIPRLYSRWSSGGAREIFFQAWGADEETMLDRGRSLAALGPDVVVKVPATRVGFIVARALIREEVPVLLTAVYAPAQALAAASIGARYIAPYLGRLEDAGRDGVAEIAHMTNLLDSTQTEVLAASLRSREAIVSLADVGVRHFTAAPAVIWATLTDDVSDISAAQFETDMQ